jgi:comEA protein
MRTFATKGAAFGTILALLLLTFSWTYADAPKPAAAKVNINTASAADLEALPRIGPKVAQRIVDFRTQNGNFKKIEEIMKVKGIGEKLFNRIKDLITVETK